MRHDLITIGITCYNAEGSIARAVESALAQRWPRCEVIVVDDASTDGSAAVVQAYADNNPAVRLVRRAENGGPAAARQDILDHARGAFIAFFDDDDESLPSRVEAQHQRITAYEQETGAALVACYASGRRLYPGGYTVDLAAIGSRPRVPQGAEVAARLLFYGPQGDAFYGSGTPTCSLMARREVLQGVGGFDPAFRRVEDVDLAIRLALAGGHFIGCPESLFIQYASDGVDKAPEKNRDAEIQLADKHQAYLRSVGRYRYARKWPLLRYYHFKRRYFKMLLVLAELFLFYPFKTASHFLSTAPRRFMHERRMKS